MDDYVSEKEDHMTELMAIIILYIILVVVIHWALGFTKVTSLEATEQSEKEEKEVQEEKPVAWKSIGTYKDRPLYERTYASGKKAWRYMNNGINLYLHKRDLVKGEIISTH